MAQHRKHSVFDGRHFHGRHSYVRGNLLVPYTTFDVSNALTGVVCGPGHQSDPTRATYGMQAFLDSVGHTQLTLAASLQPYRP